jgi:hypothetical protein
MDQADHRKAGKRSLSLDAADHSPSKRQQEHPRCQAMLFLRTGRTDQRRRRVLHDTLLANSLALGTGLTRRRNTRYARDLYAGKSQNYGDAMVLESQTRLTDLVPMHPILLAVVLIAGFGIIALLEGLYLWTWQMGRGIGRIAAFDLADRGSLATWFSSLILAMAAATAVLVFTVRRHRLDDYRGHYRIWLWSAACWLLMSIDATANLHDGFGEIMVWLTGTRLFGESCMWWLMICGFVIAAVSLRLLVDMRHCWPSATALVATAACYGICLGFHFHCIPIHALKWPPVEEAARAVAINKAVLMGGNFLLLMAMIWHARYVVLDAEGLLPRRRRARGRLAEEVYVVNDGGLMANGSQTVTVHPPHGLVMASPEVLAVEQARGASMMRSSPTLVVASAADAGTSLSGGAAGTLPVQRRLTKQEKKALRTRLERMREEHERQAG